MRATRKKNGSFHIIGMSVTSLTQAALWILLKNTFAMHETSFEKTDW